MTDWRPIDAAPKEHVILLHIVDDGQPYTTTGIWVNGHWDSNFTMAPIKYGHPSHWMPLPESPK